MTCITPFAHVARPSSGPTEATRLRESDLAALLLSERLHMTTRDTELSPSLAQWIDALSATLGSVVGRDVRVARSRSTPPSLTAAHCAYVASVAFDRGPDRIQICVDREACRALIDPLFRDITSLRGVGSLSECEIGALDFLLTDVTDRVAALARATHDSHWTVDAPLAGSQARDHAQGLLVDRSYATIPLTIGVGAVRGHLLLGVPRASVVQPPAWAPPPSVPEAARLALSLSIGAMELPASEWDSLSVGDLLLLDAIELTSLGNDACLVAASGAVVADVRVRHDEPTLCSVEPTRLAVRMHCAPPVEGLVRIRPLIGSAELSVRELRHLAVGDRIDLHKSAPDVLLDVRRPTRVEQVPGQLVRYGSRLAVRLRGGTHAPKTS